jgi:sulfide:quinone oxidoreductase
MKRILILGAGTAGTMMANKFRKVLSKETWNITIVDQDEVHYYQPGFLFIPFGIYNRKDVVKPKGKFIPKGVDIIYSIIDHIDAEKSKVILANGTVLNYDYLIIATGVQTRPEETTGLNEDLWYKKIFDFYTVEGSLAMQEFFKTWTGGDLVMAITEIPFKCPIAPIEFVCLADEFFTKKRMREKVNISFVTPLPGAFTKPIATKMLSKMMSEKNITVITDYYIEKVDNKNQKLISYDGREVHFDAMAIVPVNMGADVIGKSGLGDDLNLVPTNKNTLRSDKYENIFVIGDASNIPTSKAGSVAHFESDILFDNLMDSISNRPLIAKFDGHANCFVETGFGKATLIDFNYETEPLPGTYPMTMLGPFSLLKTTWFNHLGKLFFRWIYWNILLKGKKLHVSSVMSMTGKIVPADKK